MDENPNNLPKCHFTEFALCDGLAKAIWMTHKENIRKFIDNEMSYYPFLAGAYVLSRKFNANKDGFLILFRRHLVDDLILFGSQDESVVEKLAPYIFNEYWRVAHKTSYWKNGTNDLQDDPLEYPEFDKTWQALNVDDIRNIQTKLKEFKEVLAS